MFSHFGFGNLTFFLKLRILELLNYGLNCQFSISAVRVGKTVDFELLVVKVVLCQPPTLPRFTPINELVSQFLYRYKDLINNFPDDMKGDRYFSIVLNKIAQYGSVCILQGALIFLEHLIR